MNKRARTRKVISMKHIGIYLILVFVVITLTGCSSGTQTTTGKAFVGGTEGLKMTYMPGSPPATIVDGGNSGFGIVVKLENVGEYNIKANDGYVKILGLEAGTYGETKYADFKQNFGSDINGAVKNYDGSVRNGQTATVEFGDLKYIPSIAGDLQQNVYAEACYKYQTRVATQICIKKDAQQMLNNNKICDVEGETNPQNSGAPVQITSLKESFAGNGKIGVTMTISHVGTGDAFFKDSVSECNDVETNTDRDKVKISFKPVQIGSANIYPKCTGLSEANAGSSEGFVRLYRDNSGKATATLYCTIDAGSVNSIFEVPLEATLSYKYLQHIETPLNIRHVAQQ